MAIDWINEADGVFRGGGVKGLGLAGALVGFAEHPTKPITKWVNVAGASAGAIIAAYLATGHSADEMQKLMARTSFAAFKDIGRMGRLGAIPNLMLRHGICRGKAFQDWFSHELDRATFAKVKSDDGKRYRLKLITVDVANREMLVLPDDLLDENGKPKYVDPSTRQEIYPDGLEIARAARMSMSIPYFFEPVELRTVDGRPVTLVDGGTLSNFPVWLFDVERQPPKRPTFGFTLTGGKGVGGGAEKLVRALPWAAEFGWQITHTAMEAWDKRFVSHSARVRTVVVDAGDVGTTDFNLSDVKKQMLVQNGQTAARTFLDQFDLSKYFNTFGQGLAPTPAPDREPVGSGVAGN
jgi:NTE family protein